MQAASRTPATKLNPHYRDFKSISTSVLQHGAGSATLDVKLHTITERDSDGVDTEFKVVEKALPADKATREVKAYELLAKIKKSKTPDIAEHPHIFSIVHSGGVANVFMEHARGREINFGDTCPEHAGRVLGHMSQKYGGVFPDMAPFNKGRAANPVLTAERNKIVEICGDNDEASDIFSVVEKFNNASSMIMQWQSAAERALCHGDVKSSNLIVVGSGDRPVCYFIDWAGVAWDCVGTDIGGLFLTKKYANFEATGDNIALEDSLFRGYAAGIGRDFTIAFKEELEMAANLHFSVRFFSWAVKSKNKGLLRRSVNRAERVLRHFI